MNGSFSGGRSNSRPGGFRDRPKFGGSRNGGGQGRSFGGPREMHKAVCADCGKECEVPFKPVEGRDVYCRDCYPNHRPARD
ncbi:DNA-directed RNA polymerase [Candidatus Woesearchaeota archaeon]|nr:DNA-directed RNA polymerase [Candidatus Woesearchaeota archaeon]